MNKMNALLLFFFVLQCDSWLIDYILGTMNDEAVISAGPELGNERGFSEQLRRVMFSDV